MPRRFALLPAVAVFAASGASAQVSAPAGESSPWYVGVRQTFGYEDNVHVTAEGTSDRYSTTALRGGLNTRLGRQRLFADGSVFHTRYDKNDDLDYNGHNVRAGLEWATVGNLTGSVVGSSAKQLVRLTVPGAVLDPLVPAETRSPIQRVDGLDASAHLGTAGPLGIEAGYSHRRLSYDDPNPFVAAEEYRRNDVSLGVSYRVSGALRVGAGAHGQETEYEEPNPADPTAPPDRAKRRAVYLSANWVPSEASILDTRLSIGKTEYDVFTERDTKGVTGYVSWDWKPTGKLRFLTSLSRDTGSDFSVQRVSADSLGADALPVGAVTDPVTGDLITTTAFSRTVTTLAWRGTWAATAKIDVDTGFTYQHSSLSTGGSNNAKAVSVGANWAATRALTFGCAYAQELRSGDDPKSFNCFGQFLLQ